MGVRGCLTIDGFGTRQVPVPIGQDRRPGPRVTELTTAAPTTYRTSRAADLPCLLMAIGSENELVRGDSRGAARVGAASPRSILLVAPSWPHPPTWGFAMRVYHLAKQLSSRHRVSLLTYDGGNTATAQSGASSIFESVDFVRRPAAVRSKRRAQAESLLSPRSHHVGGLRSAEMEVTLQNLLARRAFDLIQLESSQMAFCAPFSDVPVVLDEHNIEYLLLRRLAEVESSPARKAFGYMEAGKVRREEVRAWTRSAGSIFTSRADMDVMRATLPAKPACVVPNGVDLEYFQPGADEPDKSTVVFTGSINYRPNTDAVAFFVRDVMPRLLRLKPSTKFVVVGQGAPDWLLRMSGTNVQFTGAVSDVRPYLARAAVVVAPLRAGSGTRLKILEALAMEKPVVTTSIGCEGLAMVDGQHLVVADDPQSFAEETARLMSDRKLAAELGRSGRALAERDYSWSVIVHRLEQFHSELISKETRV
jgi:glycosyltransferase involved in cell wall biosynthesis